MHTNVMLLHGWLLPGPRDSPGRGGGDDDALSERSPSPSTAVLNIISLFRVALARRAAAVMATAVYQKYWEPTWGTQYYFNPRTKQVGTAFLW
jgi:hypothetical protein